MIVRSAIMNERDVEIMQIAYDLLTQQNVLIEQQRKVIDALTEVIRAIVAEKLM